MESRWHTLSMELRRLQTNIQATAIQDWSAISVAMSNARRNDTNEVDAPLSKRHHPKVPPIKCHKQKSSTLALTSQSAFLNVHSAQ
eukprot:1161861-Pelagomonas_calceolata.AAC.6